MYDEGLAWAAESGGGIAIAPPSDSNVQPRLRTNGLHFQLGDTWVLGKVPKILTHCVKNWFLNKYPLPQY